MSVNCNTIEKNVCLHRWLWLCRPSNTCNTWSWSMSVNCKTIEQMYDYDYHVLLLLNERKLQNNWGGGSISGKTCSNARMLSTGNRPNSITVNQIQIRIQWFNACNEPCPTSEIILCKEFEATDNWHWQRYHQSVRDYTISKLNICMENIRIKLSLKDQKYLLGG